MKVKDVTEDWVTENFDIDKERKVKKHRIEVGCIDAFNSYDQVDYGLYLNNIRKEIKQRIRETAKLFGMRVQQCVGLVNVLPEWDEYDNLDLTVAFEKEETDAQVISRIRSREKQKIKRQTTQLRDAADLKQRKKLKDELARLETKMGMRS